MQNTSSFSFKALVLAAAVSAGVAWAVAGGQTGVQANNEPAYARVMETKTLRCGYFIYPPALQKDPNTGKLSGIFVDEVEAASSRMGLKVEWAKEVVFATMIEELKLGKFDAVCGPTWPIAARAPFAEFSQPFYYSGIGVYVRSENEKIRSLEDVNSPSVRIATLEGEMTHVLAQQHFPRAQKIALPQFSDVPQLLHYLAEGKADVGLIETQYAGDFIRRRGKIIRNIVPENPLQAYGSTLMFAKGEFRLKSMFDTAIQEDLQSGAVSEIMARYEGARESFYSVLAPYALPAQGE